jgi:hypothetical protein
LPKATAPHKNQPGGKSKQLCSSIEKLIQRSKSAQASMLFGKFVKKESIITRKK